MPGVHGASSWSPPSCDPVISLSPSHSPPAPWRRSSTPWWRRREFQMCSPCRCVGRACPWLEPVPTEVVLWVSFSLKGDTHTITNARGWSEEMGVAAHGGSVGFGATSCGSFYTWAALGVAMPPPPTQDFSFCLLEGGGGQVRTQEARMMAVTRPACTSSLSPDTCVRAYPGSKSSAPGEPRPPGHVMEVTGGAHSTTPPTQEQRPG